MFMTYINNTWVNCRDFSEYGGVPEQPDITDKFRPKITVVWLVFFSLIWRSRVQISDRRSDKRAEVSRTFLPMPKSKAVLFLLHFLQECFHSVIPMPATCIDYINIFNLIIIVPLASTNYEAFNYAASPPKWCFFNPLTSTYCPLYTVLKRLQSMLCSYCEKSRSKLVQKYKQNYLLFHVSVFLIFRVLYSRREDEGFQAE